MHSVSRRSADTWASGDVEVRVLERPDGQLSLRPPDGNPDCWSSIIQAIRDDTRASLVCETPSDAPQPTQDALRRAGFRPVRREQTWLIPLDRLEPLDVMCSSHQLISVTTADPRRVVALDNELRNDIPGAAGWRGTVEQLRASFDDSDFDPALYLVAQHLTGRYDGLVRVWNRSPVPRLGCVAVRREWRRTRLTAALLSDVTTKLLQRGVTTVTAETDQTNRNSHRMAQRLHGQPRTLAIEWQAAPVDRFAVEAGTQL